MLERLGCNPLQVLAMIANNDKDGLGEDKDIAIALRQKAASDLMPYIAPKLRSTQVEVTGPQHDQRLIVVADAEFAAHLKESCGDSVDIQVDGKSVGFDTYNNAS